MANTEDIERLKQGVEAWNAWRRESPEAAADLSGAGLRGLDLTGANLSGVDLSGADLRGTILSEADLTGARLDGANLFKAVIADADLAGASLLATQFLNCAQLIAARNWQQAFRDEGLDCGAPIPVRDGPSE